MRARDVRDACATCGRVFEFLITDYGYRNAGCKFDRPGFTLRFQGPAVGVVVDWFPRDRLTVWVAMLVGGDFPPPSGVIGPNTTLHSFHLGDLEVISGYQRELDDDELYNVPNEQTAGALAESLRSCGADLLAGDLTRVPLLERRVKNRARDIAIAQYGLDAARKLGW